MVIQLDDSLGELEERNAGENGFSISSIFLPLVSLKKWFIIRLAIVSTIIKDRNQHQKKTK